jgi:signal transduction histidine kinase/DNA-binding response OmpR family regulator
MHAIPVWLTAVSLRQDYLWFLVAAGWAGLLALARGTRSPALVAVGLCSILYGFSEVGGMFFFADSSGSPEKFSQALGLTACLAPVAVFLTGVRARFRGIGLAFAIPVAALILGGGLASQLWFPLAARYPIVSSATVTFLACGAGIVGAIWLNRRPKEVSWTAVYVLASCMPLIAPSGFLAELIGWTRRWLVVSPLGVLSAAWQIGMIGSAFAIWIRQARRNGTGIPNHRDMRVIFALVCVWLAMGALLVEAAGLGAYNAFVTSNRARSRTLLSTFDRETLATLLDETFRLGDIRPGRNPVRKSWVAAAPVTLTPAFQPVRLHLSELQRDNPDFSAIYMTTIRQGWLTGAILPWSEDPRFSGVVNVEYKAEGIDWMRWADRVGYVDGPKWTPRGTLLQIAEPIVSPEGKMLGWLTVELDSHHVLATQAPARILTCLTVTMASVVAGGFIVLRARGQAQREAREQAAAALAADRMKSALLAHVSHELRTPLQGILGYAELLAGRPLDESQRGWLSSQRRQGELLLRLVNDLIDLGALQNGVFAFAAKPAQLAPLAEETVLSLRPRAHVRHLQLELELDAALPTWLVFDADRVRQVILNLVGNAIKFTDVGHVGVHVRLISTDGAEAVVEIAVADTGPGIAPEEQARLFQPFTRLDRTSHLEGTGLGLALARGLCLGMKGSLIVESDGRSGSTFRAWLTLPIGGPSDQRSETVEPSRAHRGLRIVVAEDNTLVRELYLAHLSSQGAECSHAMDGMAAVELVRSQQPAPDVLLLDLAMPRLDGIEVARQLRTMGPGALRIIGVSAHGNPAYRQRALDAGMDDFLVKPVKLSELSRCVQRLAGQTMISPHSNLPEALRQKLQQVFAEEYPKVLGDLGQALEKKEWAVVEARAHYLKNSAWALGDTWLAGRCETICEAAQRGDETVARTALTDIQMRPPDGA